MLNIIAWSEIAVTVPLWWVTLYKLLPLYRTGRIAGGWRIAYKMLTALLSWYTLMAGLVIGGGNTWLGWMITLPFAVVMLTWAAVAVGTQDGKRAPTMTQDVQGIDPASVKVRTVPQPQPVTVEAYSAGGGRVRQRGPRASRVMREVEA